MTRRIVLILLLFVAAGAAVWATLRFARPRLHDFRANDSAAVENSAPSNSWTEAVEQVKADRGEPAGVSARVETPPELKHYSERHWFLATQVAEVAKHKFDTCQNYMDLAAMIQRGEMVTLPAVTDSYVLFGVGEMADEDPFVRYEDGRSVELYDEPQLNQAYKQLDEKRAQLQSEIDSLKSEATKLNKRERTKRNELQKQITALQGELNSITEEKKSLDEFYGQAESRQKLFSDYEALKALARNFAGRSYDIDNPADRHAMKIHMLSSLRPAALKILEEVASAYHLQFGRRLPASSLVRPEQYQRALRRVNRNAILIDTPPHSTGLAFDIDFRFMSGREQTFVMNELARLKREGRIEVIRERNANYHVFAFLDGTRPNDELIAASLEEARGGPVQQAHHAPKKATNVKSRKASKRSVKPRKTQRPRSNVRQSRRRRGALD
ncbi:MAG TPA: DUF5715 family protein [Pyrinomonadaceae bacterium]|nr:DUF5715 family protein [Pyrinomonadaceae bacterium]